MNNKVTVMVACTDSSNYTSSYGNAKSKTIITVIMVLATGNSSSSIDCSHWNSCITNTDNNMKTKVIDTERKQN